MSTNAEDNKLDWESVLYYLKGTICKYLAVKDLYNLTQVNKSWREAAVREKAKRFYILHLPLPYNGSNLASLLDENSIGSLLICNKRFEKSLHSLLGDQINLQKNMIVLKVYEYLTTEMNLEESKDEHNSEPIGNLNILALFFSNLEKQARVYMASTKGNHLKRHQGISYEAKILAEELGMSNCEYPKSTLLLFENWFNCYGGDMAGELRKRVQDGNEMTCTYVLGEQLVTANFQERIGEENLVALRLCGPSMESWSISINLFAPSEFIQRKLLVLKEKVVLKRYSIGLLQALKCCMTNCRHIEHPCGDSYGMMRTMKRIFPDIPFVGLFNKFSFSTYQLLMNNPEIDEYTHDSGLLRSLHMQTSVTIIMYD